MPSKFRALPVRTRLTIWYVVVLGAVLCSFVVGTGLVLYWQLVRQLNHFAVQDIETIEGLLYFNRNGQLALREDYHIHPQSRLLLERLVEVLSAADGHVLYRNQRLGQENLGGPPFPNEGVEGFSERSFVLRSGVHVSLVSRHYVLQGKQMVIRLGYSQQPIYVRLREFVVAACTLLPFLLAIVAFLGYQLARRTLSPLGHMAARAGQINAERLDQRLPIGNPDDELGSLARIINSVLDRLEQSFEQLRRFTADASHELRTPLAALRSVGEVGLQKNRTTAEYEDTIGSMLEEVTRLTRLVDSLLTISRADASQFQLQLTVFSPCEVIDEVIGIVEVLAQEREQSLLFSGTENLLAKGDRLLFRQALINVLQNAVKYSPARGSISIWLGSTQPGRVTVRVADNGPGIPAEHRLKIFDRFYRTDAARSRDAGGVGLGLSIANWALTAQGGKIRVEDSPVGATFAIELPAADTNEEHRPGIANGVGE